MRHSAARLTTAEPFGFWYGLKELTLRTRPCALRLQAVSTAAYSQTTLVCKVMPSMTKMPSELRLLD